MAPNSSNPRETASELPPDRTDAAVIPRCTQSTADLDMVKNRVGPNGARSQVTRIGKGDTYICLSDEPPATPTTMRRQRRRVR